ncbi:phosphotransferase enzyme family protein [Microlunatus sp. GCM10028923]|uniref:phosphotransferase enzyme family protein n=1 Tax=Microlunatus sp. GCM10028923 TaxID=3273400 RepID=UPI003610EC3A
MLSTEEVRRLIEGDYAREPTRIDLIANGHNDTYLVEAAGATFAFRVYGEGKSWIRDTSDLRCELDLLTHLKSRRAPISYPIERRSGGTLGSRPAPTGTRHYALFSWCPGQPVSANDLTLPQAERLGTALALIHAAADDFVSEHSRYSLDLATLLDRSLQRLRPTLQEADPRDVRFIEDCAVRIRERLGAFEPGPGGWGLIHGDPQALNIHFTDDGSVRFFDFDHCAFGWRAYDLAYCLRHTSADDDRQGETLRAAVIGGYTSVRPLTDAEQELLPTLGQAAWIHEGTEVGHGLPATKLARLLRDPFGPWD